MKPFLTLLALTSIATATAAYFQGILILIMGILCYLGAGTNALFFGLGLFVGGPEEIYDVLEDKDRMTSYVLYAPLFVSLILGLFDEAARPYFATLWIGYLVITCVSFLYLPLRAYKTHRIYKNNT